jgi:putative acetyltransferase
LQIMLTLRASTPGDLPAILAVHCAAFPTDEEARLVEALLAGGNTLVSLVAERGSVLGHVLFSPVTVEPPGGGPGAGLAPLAVLPAHQRQGAGTRLVEAGIQACRRAGLAWLVVVGSPRYYGRFGFRRADALGLGNEFGVGEEFMALELAPGGLPPGGLVRYRPEFGVFGPAG